VEKLIVVIIFGVIAFANFLIKKSREDSGEFSSPPEPPVIRRPPVQRRPAAQGESEEERMRRFMEALGMPPVAQPPPLIQRPAVRQPAESGQVAKPVQAAQPSVQGSAARPNAGVPRNPVPVVVRQRRTVVVPSAPRQTPPPIPAVAGVQSRATASRPEPEASFSEASALPSQQESPDLAMPDQSVSEPVVAAAPVQSVDPMGIRAMLQNPANVRAAMVLREVLGSPRGLQAYRL